MDPLTVLGWIGVVVSTSLMLYSLSVVLRELSWRAHWRSGLTRKLKRSVRLGWNTGLPPENVEILVRDHASLLDARSYGPNYAVMKRRGDTCYATDGSMSTPVANITGWLEIVT